jgi:hypothetical protein
MKSKTYSIMLALCFLVANQISQAQIMPPTFSQNKYGILDYGLFIPSPYDTAKKYPLITSLHGYSDTLSQPLEWYSSDVQSVNPCFVFTPKCPTSDQGGWGNSWQGSFSMRMRLALEVIDSLIKNYNIDTNRLYILGGSMGGYGTFDVLYRQPGRFAAAMVLCGGGNPATAAQVMQTPLWIFHGSADPTVNISQSRDIYDRMIEIGAKEVRFTEYPGVGHNVWDYAPHELAWLDWIFDFSNTDNFTEKPDIPINVTSTVRSDGLSFNLIWNDVSNRLEKKNKIWYYKIFRDESIIATPNYSVTSYVDITPHEGLNTYKITSINYDFIESDTSNTATGVVTSTNTQDEKQIPSTMALSQNYPNPFNPSTTIEYQIPPSPFFEKGERGGFVSLKVFDVLGREVATLVNEQKPAGRYTVQWNAAGMSSGIYFYTLQTNKMNFQKKMVLIR